jgi:hypothetical protein
MPHGQQIGDPTIPWRQGLKPSWEIAPKADLIENGRLPVIRESFGPCFGFLAKAVHAKSLALRGQRRKHVPTIEWAPDSAAVVNMLRRSCRQHRGKLKRIFAAPDQANEAQIGCGDGFRDRFFAVDLGQMPESNCRMTFDCRFDGQEVVA